MIKISDVKIPVMSGESLKSAAAKKIGVGEERLLGLKILRKSLDARRRGNAVWVYSVAAEVADEGEVLAKGIHGVCTFEDEMYQFRYKDIKSDSRPVVVGTGPAGLFCALMLARAGLKPLVFERGGNVADREAAVERFKSGGALDENCNIQFGEGGAGTFSDGKLTCGVNDRRIAFVLNEFARHGAPDEITYLAKPHIGTDYLKSVVKNIRDEIISLGGEVRFNTVLTDIETAKGAVCAAEFKELNGSTCRVECKTLVLATGHSSRDTYAILCQKGFKMEKKPFSVGVRIEHKRKYINLLQYKDEYLAESLPAADYKLSCHPNGRGVYTFCMCPGGTVVCGSSESGGVVTNGMSCFARDEENSNSALLVSVLPSDIEGESPMCSVEFQRKIERAAFELGGSDYYAPCQRVDDFLNSRKTENFGSVKPSYLPGVRFADLSGCLPDFVCKSLKEALSELDGKMKGFCLGDALLTGVETRSSAPLRILRGEDMCALGADGVYPIGEGAGYAGGITSSAVDGIKCAEIICSRE